MLEITKIRVNYNKGGVRHMGDAAMLALEQHKASSKKEGLNVSSKDES